MLCHVLSSGSSNLLYNSTAESLGIDVFGGSARVVDATGDKSRGKKAVVSQLTIADLDIIDVGFVVIDDPAYECYDAQGVIGWELMNGMYWKYDSEGGVQITKNLPDVDGFEKVELSFSKGRDDLLMLPLVVDGKKANFLLDLGFNGQISVPGTGGYVNHTIGLLSDDYEVTCLERVEVMNLVGIAFLNNFNFILDWSAPAIYLQEKVDQDFDKSVFGFATKWTEGSAEVVSIVPDSHAERSTLSPRSRILFYNGISVTDSASYCGMKYDLSILDSVELVVANGEIVDSILILRTTL